MDSRLQRSLLPLALALLASPALRAADLYGGVQLFLAAPQSDLNTISDGSVGADLKIYMLIDLGQGFVLRPELDGLSFTGQPNQVPRDNGTIKLPTKTDVTTSMGSLGVLYLRYFSPSVNDPGFYAGAGLGFSDNKVSIKAPGYAEQSDKTTKAYYSVVAGYQFGKHWNVEASYRYTKFSAGIENSSGAAVDKATYTLPAILVGGGYRF